jgi:hypothetical protein
MTDGALRWQTLPSSLVELWGERGAGVWDMGNFLVEEVDAVGAADAGVGVAGEGEKTATVAELRDAAIVFVSGIEEKIAAGIGIAATEVLEERGVPEIPLPDFGIEGRIVVERQDAEVDWIFGLICDERLELELCKDSWEFFADGLENFASVESLEEASASIEPWRGPERRGGIREREGEGDFLAAGERLPTDEKVCGAEGLVFDGEKNARRLSTGGSGNAVEGNGVGNELPEGLALGFVFWSGRDGVGAVFGFDGFGLVVGDQREIAGSDAADLIARRERKGAIVDLVDGNFLGTGEGMPAGFAFDLVQERDGKGIFRLGRE